MNASAGFNFTHRIRAVCEHITLNVPELSHVDLSRVAISFSQARTRSSWGIFASLTPLRFQGGGSIGKKRGRTYTIQRVLDASGREMLYILTFYLPRFLDQIYREKLITIFHELWHISPAFDGDIRRHEGRCYAHTGSQANYDAQMGRFVDRWLIETQPPRHLVDFLQQDFSTLLTQHGGIRGDRYARPKLFPVKA
jgi:hypothetical protein